MAMIPYEQGSVSGSDPYSPDTEPITPCGSESDAQDILANCVSVLGLDNEEEQDLDQIRDEEHVLENQIVNEQDQAENDDNEVQIEGEHQIVYDVEDDDDIQITFENIEPEPQIPKDWRDRLKNIKKEKRYY